MQRILISPAHVQIHLVFITMVRIITRAMFPSYLRLSDGPGPSDWPPGSAPQPIRGGKQMMKLMTQTRLISILVLEKQSDSVQ